MVQYTGDFIPFTLCLREDLNYSLRGMAALPIDTPRTCQHVDMGCPACGNNPSLGSTPPQLSSLPQLQCLSFKAKGSLFKW